MQVESKSRTKFSLIFIETFLINTVSFNKHLHRLFNVKTLKGRNNSEGIAIRGRGLFSRRRSIQMKFENFVIVSFQIIANNYYDL